MSDRVPIAGPWITDLEVGYVTDAARTAWYADAGRYVTRFEEAFAAYVDTAHAISLPHCTAGLHLSLAALGVGPGDEVIVPDATWIATSAPVSYVGATPVFADIDRETWCLSAEAMEACVTPRTKAVIPVDLYGGMPDYPEIRAAAARHGLAIIEDAAEAIGSTQGGAQAGSFGDTGVFSFHGSKTLTTGEGGMLVTDRDDLAARVRFLRDHGRQPGDRHFFNREVAFKYKMSALQAAIGLAQTERIEELVAKKRAIFSWYRDRLGGEPGLTLNAEPAGVRNTYWMVTVLWGSDLALAKRDLMARLTEAGIDARPFFHPLSSLPAYEGLPSAAAARERNRVAYDVCGRGLNLPSALCLTEEQVDRVCSELLGCLRGATGSV